MRTLVLFMALVVAGVYASHYRGGTFYWERLGNKHIRIFWRLAFEQNYDFEEYFCNFIGQEKQAETALALTCTDCRENKTISSPLYLECAFTSKEMKWSLFDGYVDYKADREAFTIAFKTKEECSDSSWIGLQNYGGGKCWSLLTKVDTSIKLENNSPRVMAGLPVHRVRQGCNRVIDLNPIDIDGDPVKCRWTRTNECPERRSDTLYNNDPVCGRPTDFTTLNTTSCTIEFNTGEDSAEGWYAASIMIEDFEDKSYKKAKSTVPFQFLLKVTSPGSCIGPKIDLEDCSVIAPGETWNSIATASLQKGSSASTVNEFQGSYPKGMSYFQTRITNRRIEAYLTFSPNAEGIYVFSFTATDNNGVQSDPKNGCLIAKRSPAILPQYSTPSSNSLYKEIDEFWTIKFDSPISRPEKSAYIMVMDSSGTKYAKYDAANPDEVEFPAGDPTIARYKALKNLEAGTYLVSLDKGFSVTLNACMLCKVLHSSSAFRYVFSILVKPRIDLEECSVIAPGETWNSVVTALIPKDSDASIQKGSGAQNVTEIQGSLPYGMIMSYVKDSEPGKKVVKAKLSFRPNEEGTYIFNFTATDNNGAQSYPKAGYLIVSAYGFPMNVNVDPPVLLPEFSNPSCNFLYEGREEFWTIKFDSPVTRPTRWKAFIKIQDMNTTKVIAKYNALDMNVVRFSDSDPTIVKYPAPTAVLGDRVYRVDVDLGFVVRVFGTPCGRNHIAVGEGGMYNFQTSKRPEVECGESYIKVRIPKTYVNNIPASELHLHDTRCRIQDNHPMYYQIEFGYDECGTIIKHLSQSKTTFYNTIRDDPKPILPDVPITRAKHNVEIQIICEMRGLGGNDVFFKTAADVKPDIYKANGKFKTYRKMYEDSSYNRDITGTASVELKEKLYFAAHSTSSKEVAIESCRAMPKFGTCTHNNTVYTIIKNGCGVGPSAVSLSSSGLDHRFSIKSFGFMHYDLTNEVFMKCKIVSCKPASNSRCADLKSGNCSSRRRRGAIIEEESDTFMTFKIL